MWGATYQVISLVCEWQISTHTPHVGCDVTLLDLEGIKVRFQLTHPMWGATKEQRKEVIAGFISTHTPHVGCDRLVGRNV